MAKVYSVTGAAEIRAKLEELGKRGALKVGRAALRKAARAIANEAKAAAPSDEGRLRKGITVTVDRGRHDRRDLYATVKVKGRAQYRPRTTDNATTRKGKKAKWGGSHQIGSTPEVYGAFQEFGAPNRNIAPKGYFRRAWDSEGGQQALRRIGEELGKGLEREAAGGGSFSLGLADDVDLA